MADAAHVDTDKKIKKLEKNIKEVYNEAQADMEDKINDFVKKYHAKESIYAQQVKEGKITQEQFDNWKKGQVFQGKQWQAKRDQIISTIHDSNIIATKIINGAAFGVFKNNANYTAYDLEHSNGVNFGFGIYDTSTVSKLLKDNPDLLPKWKVDEQKDYVWNKKKVNNAVTQGIIQGERLDQITKRISTGLAAQNENTMKTFARTAMTGAQNAGREQRLMTLKAKGINVVKQWMATLDGRTRHSHRMMDGETLPVAKDIWHPVTFSNGCRYPGDPQGPAQEVYNCRCTMVGDVPDFPDEYKRYDNIDGKPIKNMTYQEWYKAKYNKELKTKEIINSTKPDNKKEFVVSDEVKNTISAEAASEDWFEYENANIMSSYVETGEMPTEDMYGTVLSEETRQKLAAEAELIQNTAISTKTEYKTLYRGMVLDEDEARAMFTPGENFTFKTLTASTPSKDIAKIYMDVDNRGGEGIPAILEIQKGDGIYGFDRDGMETILPKGSQFRVTRNYMDENGVVHVSLYAKKGNNIVIPKAVGEVNKTHEIAVETLNKAKKAEKTVSKDLKKAVSAGTGHLEGYDFRFKSEGSLERKIVDKSVKKGLTQEEYASKITDALRYTNVSEPQNLTSDYFKIVNSLESNGYRMVEVTNTLKIKDAEYRGINTLVKDPNGYIFELQFHTPQSLEVKEVNHKLYEQQRLATTSEDAKEQLGKEMTKNALNIKTPTNIEWIQDIDKQ